MVLNSTSPTDTIINIGFIREFQIIKRVNNLYFQLLQNLINFLLLLRSMCHRIYIISHVISDVVGSEIVIILTQTFTIWFTYPVGSLILPFIIYSSSSNFFSLRQKEDNIINHNYMSKVRLSKNDQFSNSLEKYQALMDYSRDRVKLASVGKKLVIEYPEILV